MAVPSFDQFIEAILRFLATRPEGSRVRDVYQAVADALGISASDRAIFLPSGAQEVFKNRIGWAHHRLKHHGLSFSPRTGWWRLTEPGIEFALSHPPPLSSEEIVGLARVDRGPHVQIPPQEAGSLFPPPQTPIPKLGEPGGPEERLWGAYEEIRGNTAAELLESVLEMEPSRFELLVLDLLHAMGYGASRADLQHVGRSGDGGIDGIISLDRLGLEKVFIQAKRWQNPVPAEPIKAFYGALAAHRATKGVFITTSSFTKGAKEFAESVGGIVLVDGAKLCELMMDHGVGTTSRTISIPRIDRDYFEE